MEKKKLTERILSSKIVRVGMSLALAMSVCVTVPATAMASESVEVTIGDDLPYAGYGTTHMWADGEIAYCADPAAATPEPGTYEKSGVSDKELIAAMWFSYGAPGFDESMFPDAWYDGSGWTDDKYQAASHVLLAYAYQESKDEAAYGTDGEFEDWARSELLGTTWKKITANADKVSTGFTAYCIHTGEGSQVLMSFKWEKGGLKLAKEDSEAGAEPQGDGKLSGAKFDIVNESGCYAYVGGSYYADGEVVRTVTAKWDESAGAYVAETSDSALPCGTYKVVESSAPTGYNLSSWSKTVKVSSGEVADLTGKPCGDDVIRGGVQVTKNDLELQASEALGGNAHDTLATGTTLSGIEFTITNESEHKVLVEGSWYEPGDVVKVITTAWNDDVKAYTAQTSTDCLPYGTYSIQETKTNDSYLLTDGEARTFQVRDEGKVVTASTDGGSLDFYDQVVRNDLKLSKKADSDNASLMVPFVVTNVSTGESHVLVTDRNGQTSTASSWNKHSNDTNGNDGLMGAESITSDMIDSKAGIWFYLGEDGSEAAVNDSLGALPYGEYELKELRCEANEGLELVTKKFWVERDSTAAEAVWMPIDDKDGPKIQTEETDAADGDHYAQAAEEVTLVDTVYYENLKTDGTEYTVTGTLMVKSTGEALLDSEGNAITATETFKPKSVSGEVKLEFTFDASLLAGEDVVAFESLVSDGIEVAAHADIDDEGQTVHFLDIRTTATDASDGDKLVTGSEVTVTDEVAYEGLTPGAEYVLTATLYDAETGEPVMDGEELLAKEVTGTATFTPEEADGTQAVELAFSAEGLGGHRLVVFESLSLDGTQVATHEDIDDEGQSVTAVEIGTTLVDAADGDHVIESGKVKLTDTIEYEGLVPGETYTAHGTLMLKASGMPLEDADGNPVTATAEFTPEKSSGTAEVTFEFDASKIEEGVELVAFEECLDVSGNVVAVHQDIDDEGQTVVVDNPDTSETPTEPGKGYDKTGGDVSPLYVAVVALLIAGAGAGGFAWRWRRDQKTHEAGVEEPEGESEE